MEPTPPAPTSAASLLKRLAAAWDRFWFTAADPTTLGLVRFCTGLVMTYTMIAYTLDLQELLGSQAWLDLKARQEMRYEMPALSTTLSWMRESAPPPRNEEQRKYYEDYVQTYQQPPT